MYEKERTEKEGGISAGAVSECTGVALSYDIMLPEYSLLLCIMSVKTFIVTLVVVPGDRQATRNSSSFFFFQIYISPEYSLPSANFGVS